MKKTTSIGLLALCVLAILIFYCIKMCGAEVLAGAFDASLDRYTEYRSEGHTIRYSIAASGHEGTKPESIPESDWKDLMIAYPELNATWLKKANEEELEYANGEKARKVNYVVIDGDIAWQYPIVYYANGTSEACFWDNDKCDAKEYDPKYRRIFEEVDKKVRQTMEAENIAGLGACHAYWRYKKEYLRKEGIKWKSPAELNPGIRYD